MLSLDVVVSEQQGAGTGAIGATGTGATGSFEPAGGIGGTDVRIGIFLHVLGIRRRFNFYWNLNRPASVHGNK